MPEPEPDGVPRRPPLARWWASAGVALAVAVLVSAVGHAAGLPYPATAGIVGAVAAAGVGGLYVLVRRARDPRADLRELAEGRLEPTAPSTSAVLGVGLFVFDQFAAAIIAPFGSTDTTVAVLSSYVLPCLAAFALAWWAGRFSERPFPAVLAGSAIAVFLDTVVLVIAVGIPLSQLGSAIPVVVGYWSIRGAVFLLGGMAGAVVSARGRESFLARREARLTAALRGGGDVGGRP